jgi:hypothetical protein
MKTQSLRAPDEIKRHQTVCQFRSENFGSRIISIWQMRSNVALKFEFCSENPALGRHNSPCSGLSVMRFVGYSLNGTKTKMHCMPYLKAKRQGFVNCTLVFEFLGPKTSE